MSRPPSWMLLCLGLICLMALISMTRNLDPGPSTITVITNVDGQIRREFAASGRAIEVKVDVGTRELKEQTPALDYPVWRFGYQEGDPKPSLRERIHKAMDDVNPPLIRIKTGLTPESDNKIPRIVHQLWKSTDVPENTKDWIEKWTKTNPGWTYMFWTDTSAREFVSNYYPMLLERYDSYAYPVQKADMFRYILLYAIGGVYADIDIEPLKSLDPIRDWAPCILSTEPDAHVHVSARLAKPETNYTLACNAFMACRPGHPYMFFLISELLRVWDIMSKEKKREKFRNKCPLEETLGCTGPYRATVSYVFYRKSYGKLLEEFPAENVIAGKAEYFTPTFAEHAIPALKRICTSLRNPNPRKRTRLDRKGRGVCINLLGNGFKNAPITDASFTNHHWYDSYHFKGKRSSVPLLSLIPNAVLFPNIDFEIVLASMKTKLYRSKPSIKDNVFNIGN